MNLSKHHTSLTALETKVLDQAAEKRSKWVVVTNPEFLGPEAAEVVSAHSTKREALKTARKVRPAVLFCVRYEKVDDYRGGFEIPRIDNRKFTVVEG